MTKKYNFGNQFGRFLSLVVCFSGLAVDLPSQRHPSLWSNKTSERTDGDTLTSLEYFFIRYAFNSFTIMPSPKATKNASHL